MATFRSSRNLEASIIDFLTASLEAEWSNITVQKSYKQVYEIELPSVCLRMKDSDIEWIEIGSDLIIKNVQIIIDIFATSDGQRLDIKDFIITNIKGGIPYYEYVTKKVGRESQVDTKTLAGRIRIKSIVDTIIDFDADKSTMDKHDRYRHRLTLVVSNNKVE